MSHTITRHALPQRHRLNGTRCRDCSRWLRQQRTTCPVERRANREGDRAVVELAQDLTAAFGRLPVQQYPPLVTHSLSTLTVWPWT